MKRSAKDFKKIYWIQLAIGGVLLLVLMVLLVVYGGGLNSYRPKEETIQYIAGNKLTYDENTVFSKKKDIVTVKDGESENTMDTTPILYSNNSNKKITLANNMLYTNPQYDDGCYRLNYFTSVYLEDGLVVFEKDKKTARVAGGYLFDGVNTYIFLEPVTLYIGTAKYELGALSYAKVNYRESVELYNSSIRDYKWAALSGVDVIAEYPEGYSLELGRDVIIKEDGTEALIFSAVDALNVMPLR